MIQFLLCFILALSVDAAPPPPPAGPPPAGPCAGKSNKQGNCVDWANSGYCVGAYADYMSQVCDLACCQKAAPPPPPAGPPPAETECARSDLEQLDKKSFSITKSLFRYDITMGVNIRQTSVINPSSNYDIGSFVDWNGASQTYKAEKPGCPGGKYRQATVIFQHSDVEKLISVNEPSMCNYVFDIGIPCKSIDCVVEAATAAMCTAACGTVISNTVVTPQSGNGAACEDSTYDCQPGDGACPASVPSSGFGLVGNGWCLDSSGNRLNLPGVSWQNAPIGADGSSEMCARQCEKDPACIGYMTEDMTKCDIILSSDVNAKSGISRVDSESRVFCFKKESSEVKAQKEVALGMENKRLRLVNEALKQAMEELSA